MICLLARTENTMAKIKITQTRSIIDRPKPQKRTIEALGLGRPNWTRVHNDTPQIRGMVKKVVHLVKVEELKD
jgi:large subunit ribosomal protein L30